MNNREIVERFIAERKKRSVKFIIIQSVLDIAVVIVFAILITRALDNDKSILGHVIILFIVLSSTMTSQIKIHFGSFKSFSWESHIVSDYNTADQALKNAQKAAAKGKITDTDLAAEQKKFDNTINKIAEKIKSGFSE